MGVTALAPVGAQQIKPVLCMRGARLALPITQEIKKRLLPNSQARAYRAMALAQHRGAGPPVLRKPWSSAQHGNACSYVGGFSA